MAYSYRISFEIHGDPYELYPEISDTHSSSRWDRVSYGSRMMKPLALRHLDFLQLTVSLLYIDPRHVSHPSDGHLLQGSKSGTP